MSEMNVARRNRINRYMISVKNFYLMMTVIIASIFIAMFIVSGYWFCLIPAAFVVIDFIRTRRSVRRPSMVTPDIPWPRPDPPPAPPAPVSDTSYSSSKGVIGSTSIFGVVEFISEEEFKV